MASHSSRKVSCLILQVHYLLGLETREIFIFYIRWRKNSRYSEWKKWMYPHDLKTSVLLLLLFSELPMTAKVLQCLWLLLLSSCDTTWLFVHLIDQNFIVMCWGIFCCWYTEQIFGEFWGPNMFLHFLMRKVWESWDCLAWRRLKGNFMNTY